jgi:hypothetical protein
MAQKQTPITVSEEKRLKHKDEHRGKENRNQKRKERTTQKESHKRLL